MAPRALVGLALLVTASRAEARVDPTNVGAVARPKPNVLILLDTSGSMSGEPLDQARRISAAVVDTLLQHLYREHLIEIRETLAPQNRRYAMLDRGWDRVRRLLDLNAYIGAAPVSLDAYTAMVKRQEELRPPVDPEAIRTAVADLVLPDATNQLLGVVANSRRSLFITGAPGNGKTSIARALHLALGGDIWVPRAIEVDGHIINVFDSHNHSPVDPQPAVPHDHRWINIRRPLVVVGGELTIESMDLSYDQTVKFYEAPFQVKSNGGTLLIDDFGRQRVHPRDLFNRWIIPLENRVDYLTLHTGKKIQVPFEQLLIFASNLGSADIAEEAFLRRLGYRLNVESPTPEIFGRIFRKYVEARGLRHEPRLLDGAEPHLSCRPPQLRHHLAAIGDEDHLTARDLPQIRAQPILQLLHGDRLHGK